MWGGELSFLLISPLPFLFSPLPFRRPPQASHVIPVYIPFIPLTPKSDQYHFFLVISELCKVDWSLANDKISKVEFILYVINFSPLLQ